MDFITKAKKVHGDKYDYSKVIYINNSTKVCIICPEHGEFWQRPNHHLSGHGCPKCKNVFKKDTETFINQAKEIHGDKYDYSKVEYVNNRTKVCIICPIHGEFWQTPKNHIKGQGCNKCAIRYRAENNSLTKEKFIKRAKNVHGDRYDYSKVEYVNINTEVCIIDKKYGEFWQKPVYHLSYKGCNLIRNTEDFIKKAKEIHGDRYDYSKAEYVNSHVKICIICPEHGEFWQAPNDHLNGHGCPLCGKCKNINETSLYEFINSHISEKVVREKRFPWLGLKSLDIYIPKYNIAIEYQGKQHFMPLDFFGGEKAYQETIKRDELKYNLCQINNVHLFYFSKEKKLPYKYFDRIYTDENVLLENIIQIIDNS